MSARKSEKIFRCQQFENWIVFNPESVSPCCHHLDITPPQMGMKENGLSLDSYQEWLIEIDRLNQSPHGPCRGCRYLVQNESADIMIDIRILTFTNSLVCNARCSYCNHWRTDPRTKPRYEYKRIVNQLIENGLVHKDAVFYWAGGEPTIHPEFDELIEFIGIKGIKQNVLSSGIKFSSPLLKMLNLGNTLLQVSLDAGTTETYQKFKGRTIFSQILENLERYSANPTAAKNINLKYIMSDFNNEDRDIEEFVRICKKFRIGSVNLSPEIYENKDQKTSPRTLDQMIKLGTLCTLEGLPLTIMYELFHGNNADLLKSRMEASINTLRQNFQLPRPGRTE